MKEKIIIKEKEKKEKKIPHKICNLQSLSLEKLYDDLVNEDIKKEFISNIIGKTKGSLLKTIYDLSMMQWDAAVDEVIDVFGKGIIRPFEDMVCTESWNNEAPKVAGVIRGKWDSITIGIMLDRFVIHYKTKSPETYHMIGMKFRFKWESLRTVAHSIIENEKNIISDAHLMDKLTELSYCCIETKCLYSETYI